MDWWQVGRVWWAGDWWVVFVGASSVARPGLPATRFGAPPRLFHCGECGGCVVGVWWVLAAPRGVRPTPSPGRPALAAEHPTAAGQPSAPKGWGTQPPTPWGVALRSPLAACGGRSLLRKAPASSGGNGRPRALPVAHCSRGGRRVRIPASENLPRRWSWTGAVRSWRAAPPGDHPPGDHPSPQFLATDRGTAVPDRPRRPKPPLTVPVWAPAPAYGAHKGTNNHPDRRRLGLEPDTGNKNHNRSRFRQQYPRAETRPATRIPAAPGLNALLGGRRGLGGRAHTPRPRLQCLAGSRRGQARRAVVAPAGGRCLSQE